MDMSPRSEPKPGRRCSHYAYERFHRKEQFLQTSRRGFLKWLLTAALAASTYVVIWSYSERDVLPASKKKEFNTLIIALTIALGLNIASSLKANAGELRWWILSLRQYTAKEADLILNSHQLNKLAELGITTRFTVVILFVSTFLTLNVASQIALALLGITYNVNPADTITVTRPGLVSITNMSDIQTDRVLAKGSKATQTLNARRYTANSYGLVGQAYAAGYYYNIPKPGTFYDPDYAQTFNSDDGKSWKYVFYETTPPNAKYDTTVATNRSVEVSANCLSVPVVKGGDGKSKNITIRFHDGDESYELPVVNGADQTTYLNDPTTGSNLTWSRVDAFEASSAGGWFYTCNVSIHPVENAIIKDHYLGPELTAFVPPAIALQGYGSSDQGVSNETVQFQSYPAESAFGLPLRGDADYMAGLVSGFAINAVAATAMFNDNIDYVRGMLPIKGITIEVSKWSYLHLILGLTVGLQLLVTVVSVIIANRVQVRGYSNLEVAAVLRPSIRRLGDRASMATGKDIASMVGNDVKLQYLPVRGGGFDVCIITPDHDQSPYFAKPLGAS